MDISKPLLSAAIRMDNFILWANSKIKRKKLRLFVILVNHKYYKTTNAQSAWLFAATSHASRMKSYPYEGEALNDIILIGDL